MRSTLTKVCVFLLLLGIVQAMVPGLSSVTYRKHSGFNRGGFTATNDKIDKFGKQMKNQARNNRFDFLILRKSGNGPSHTRNNWEYYISEKAEYFGNGRSGPYRAILDKNRKISSIAAKGTYGFRQCKSIEPVAQDHRNIIYKCGNSYFPFESLLSAAEVACKYIHPFETENFPARYDGPYFSKYGKERYVYPIILDSAYQHGSKIDPGTNRVVMNSVCEVVGAITENAFGKTSPCKKIDKTSGKIDK